MRRTSLQCDSAASVQPGSWPWSNHSCPPACPHWRNMSASHSVLPASQSQSSYCKCRSAFQYGSPIAEGEIRTEIEDRRGRFLVKLQGMITIKNFLCHWQLSVAFTATLYWKKKQKFVDSERAKSTTHWLYFPSDVQEKKKSYKLFSPLQSKITHIP